MAGVPAALASGTQCLGGAARLRNYGEAVAACGERPAHCVSPIRTVRAVPE
ncbi:MAG: hypothetical protein ACFE0P_01145 [Oceanicaulis sp.]